MGPDEREELGVEEMRVIAGVARAGQRAPCPACGRPLAAGVAIVTTLGDVRRRALGVTIHAACYTAVSRRGLHALMVAAYQEHRPD